ncbi:hypothetical protein AMELA_G00225000 [Ameiurus melas]|uniref:Uncharacterized protein n=1 Tax=Ameiurus melas TaxID=219545 RepID=A0A7J5ZZB4_AMEME|nr:hypothetical protein AMELA_G00225000 [Ameiurus melas]
MKLITSWRRADFYSPLFIKQTQRMMTLTMKEKLCCAVPLAGYHFLVSWISPHASSSPCVVPCSWKLCTCSTPLYPHICT